MVNPVAEEQKVAKVKTLHEMPGPSTIANLVEFFYRDGFSRIHEIQVSRQRSNGTTVTRYFLFGFQWCFSRAPLIDAIM